MADLHDSTDPTIHHHRPCDCGGPCHGVCSCDGCSEKYIAIEAMGRTLGSLRVRDPDYTQPPYAFDLRRMTSGLERHEYRSPAELQLAIAWQTIGWWARWRRAWWAIGDDYGGGVGERYGAPWRTTVLLPMVSAQGYEAFQISWRLADHVCPDASCHRPHQRARALEHERGAHGMACRAFSFGTTIALQAIDLPGMQIHRVVVDDEVHFDAGAGGPTGHVQLRGRDASRYSHTPLLVRSYIAISVRNSDAWRADNVQGSLDVLAWRRAGSPFSWRRRQLGDRCSCPVDHVEYPDGTTGTFGDCATVREMSARLTRA